MAGFRCNMCGLNHPSKLGWTRKTACLKCVKALKNIKGCYKRSNECTQPLADIDERIERHRQRVVQRLPLFPERSR